jgi:hypothetical protein
MDMTSPVGLSEDEEEALSDLLERARRGGYVVGRPVPLLKRPIRPDLTWDGATPGLVFPPLEYRVTRAAIARFNRLAARVLPDVAHSEQTAPPSMFADEAMNCIATLFGRSGRLHTGHRMKVLRPIPADSLVRSRGRIENRFERSGRKFVAVSCTVYIAEGDTETAAIEIVATLLP